MNKRIPEITIEECAEVIQAITKIQRFGFENDFFDNKYHLEAEIGQLLGMIGMLTNYWKLNPDTIETHAKNKYRAVEEYSKYNIQSEPIVP